MHLPPIVAAFLTIALIVFLFRRDIKERPNITGALWIPLLWMLIICSRQTSEWLDLFGFHLGAATLEEGSPLDACVYFSLIIAGLYVLKNRGIRLSDVVRNNQWLTIFFVYCFISIFWSDFPLVAFKRWIKILGHPIMALIVLTEADPEEALTRLMKRCAYIIVPVSILFIKYYPQWGRGFEGWTGAALNMGITTNKNALGADCFILGLFFAWRLLQVGRSEQDRATKRAELLLTGGFLIGIWWLLSMAHSSTSLVSCVIGILFVTFLGLDFVNKRMIGVYIVAIAAFCILAQLTFDIWGQFLQVLGKSDTLTDRTDVWHDVLQIPINSFLGAGFESFWLGSRLDILWAKWTFHPNQAHNGYLETYLNLGIFGVVILVAVLFATYAKALRALFHQFQLGRFRLGFLLAVVIYNWTEAAFKNISPIWFVFYIIALDYPKPEWDSAEEDETSHAEENTKWVYAEGEIAGSRSSDF